MSEGSQVSEVNLCVHILKWQSLDQGYKRYRAARAAKKTIQTAHCAVGNILLDGPTNASFAQFNSSPTAPLLSKPLTSHLVSLQPLDFTQGGH